MCELFHLFYLRYVIKYYEWRQQKKIKQLFYVDKAFKAIDQAVCCTCNPYKIPGAFPYGETPLLTLKAIADRFCLSSCDRVVELGCGRGRGVFFLNHYKQCQVKGVEWVPTFVRHAQTIAKQFNTQGVAFECADMRTVDLRGATFVYLYGTCLDELSIKKLTALFRALPPQAKIVTISYPLEGFKVDDRLTASFPWGEAEVFLNGV